MRPVVYQSDKGQWIQHPDVASFVEQDLFAAVTPAAMFDSPDDTTRKGGSFALAPGDSLVLGADAYRIAFAGFEATPPAQAPRRASAATPSRWPLPRNVDLTNLRTGETRRLTPVYLVDEGRTAAVSSRTAWPTGASRWPSAGSTWTTNQATFVIDGVNVTPEDWVVVQAYEKPLIWPALDRHLPAHARLLHCLRPPHRRPQARPLALGRRTLATAAAARKRSGSGPRPKFGGVSPATEGDGAGSALSRTRRSPPRLAAEAAGGHHLLEQRARAVLRVAELRVEHVHDGQAHVEADEVGERSGPIGCAMPSFITWSTASAVATPS